MKKILFIILSFLCGYSLQAQIVLPSMQAVHYYSGVAIVTTAVTNNTTGYSVSSGATIKSSNSAITARGLCWATASGPTTANSKTTNGSGAGTFSTSISGLSPGITYYLRAYATTSSGTSYGNEVIFTTLPIMNFAYTGNLQTFTVPAGVTSVTIEAYGAEGGYAPGPSSNNIQGGKGAYMKGKFTVAQGDVLTILAGGQGLRSPTAVCGGGGGGGSWVVKGSTLLLVAGGGGGAFCSLSSSIGGVQGGSGEITQNGGDGILATGAASSASPGGSGGLGGASNWGSGGGGWSGDGTSYAEPTTVGKKYPGATSSEGSGGYGGGGGATTVCNGSGGGGGGYSGGSSGAYQGHYTAGGGGGSYINGTLLASTRGGATSGGHGKVVVTW